MNQHHRDADFEDEEKVYLSPVLLVFLNVHGSNTQMPTD